MLRGRKAVRADRRLRADEKHLRAQSAILYKSHPKPPLLLSITVFSERMRFLSVQKTWLARASAQWLLLACDGIQNVEYEAIYLGVHCEEIR